MIHVYGAGLGGSFLCNLFDKIGVDYIVYDKSKVYKEPCAYGFMYRQTKNLLKYIKMDINDYLLSKPNTIYINNVPLKVKNICILDKYKLVNDMRETLEIKDDINIRKEDYKIDFTGHHRAVISKYINKNVRKSICIQKKVMCDISDEILIYAKKYGYAWLFPLGDNVCHIGAGVYTTEDATEKIHNLIDNLLDSYTITIEKELCSCKSEVIFDHFMKIGFYTKEGNTIALGEAGGFISAFGEGNEPALRTALYMAKLIKNHDFHEACEIFKNKVRKDMKWIINQYGFVESLNKSYLSSLFRLIDIININKKRSNVQINIDTAKHILKLVIDYGNI